MEIQSAFVTGAFDSTKEIWKKAIEYLGIQNTDGRTHIKRMGTNQIQIFQYEEVDKKSIFESSDNHELLLSTFAVTHFFILDANRVRDSVNASFSIIMASYV